MRKSNSLILFVALIALLVSCAENPGTTTMKLVLSTSSDGVSRTLLPSDSTLLDVTKYTISGTGPNGKTFTVNTDNSSVEIEGLTIGEWTVTAKGLNREGTELVSGTSTFKLTATAAPQTIVLNTLIGTGTFSYVLDWSLCDVLNPSMDVFLTGPDMDADEVPLVATLNTSTKTATISESLASGSYKVRVILKDGGQQVAGLVEAVRISNGTSTSGSHTFHFSELGPSVLTYFTDATGTPIRGTLSAEGNPETFLDGIQYTYVFSFNEPENVSTEGLSIDWYYDGNKIQETTPIDRTGSSVSIIPGNGVHRIDAVVYNKLRGSTGSAAYSFTVVPNGQVGEMALLNEHASSAISAISQGTFISALPDDMFLVVTPSSAKMYVCTVASQSLQVLKTYEASNFPYLGSVKHVFSDPEMEYVILTDNYGGTENFTALRFNQSAKTLEQVPGMRFEGLIPSFGLPFTNFTAAAFNPTKGYILLSDAGMYGFDYILKISGGTLISAGTVQKKNSTYYNVADMDISENGRYEASASASSAKFVSALTTDLGSLISMYESEAAPSALTRLRFVNNQTVVAGNSTGLYSYKVVSEAAYTKYKSIGISMTDIAADGSNYFYVADNSKRIVSFEVSGYEIAQLGSTELGSNIVRICLSGKYLAVLTSQNEIALFEVIE